jgi:hypothetical protein
MTGNYPAGSRKWQLAPGEADYFLWDNLPPGITVSARIKPDRPEMDLLETDNEAWAVPARKAKRRILLVTGGNIFLERVLGLIPEAEVYKADIARYSQLLNSEYPYDITVLDGLSGPAPPGPVLLIGPPAGSPAPGLTVATQTGRVELVPVQESPLLKFVDLAGINVGNARAVTAGTGWQADIRSGDSTVFAHGENDGRRMAVWSVNLHESDLPLRPAFPVLMQNTVDWLLPPSLGVPSSVKPGDEVKLVPPPLARAVSVEGAEGTVAELAPPFPPSPWVPSEPGLYRVVVYREGGTAVQEVAVGGYSAGEAGLQVKDPRGGGVAKAFSGLAGGRAGKPLPLAQLLVMAALLVTVIEWGVASRGR